MFGRMKLYNWIHYTPDRAEPVYGGRNSDQWCDIFIYP